MGNASAAAPAPVKSKKTLTMKLENADKTGVLNLEDQVRNFSQ
jgi:hypothetical protein